MFVPHALPLPIVSFLIQLITGGILVCLFIRILASWLNIGEGSNPLMRFIARITDPFLEAVRRFVWRVWIIDISYLVTMFLVFTIRALLLQSVMPLGW
ncbi:YggT family protein [Tengunoibacter tsumagoiensis]|uniref:YggT family protein n=1 Tax=Tengunoibacter tsumagoiensis TaxID=2014871 RepID=A0A402A4U1_9CHLR|nr:YggT family protein [Tengunoibacter tsumagoiensis]GCE14120.1 hypothetical protein KTT_39790 [Tengunoibacter tsumagoiensis]